MIGDQPLRITAQSLQLSGIRIVGGQPDRGTENVVAGEKALPPPILLAVRAQQVTLDHCRFEGVAGAVAGDGRCVESG